MPMLPRQNALQSSELPPAQPSYIFRGHSAQIHTVHFLRHNLRLLSGDADGWVVLWSIPIKRPIVVWKAHSGPILGLGSWDEDRIITHGRDSKLHVWQLSEKDESGFSTILPIDDAVSERHQPWLLHTLTVNTLNFCSFAMRQDVTKQVTSAADNGATRMLVATPGIEDGFINLTSLPAEDRLATIPSPKDTNTGMIMAIGLHQHKDQSIVLAGYESGHAARWQQDSSTKKWQVTYMNKAHTQPVLSLDIAPELGVFFTSSADAIIARHPLHKDSSLDTKTVQTKHAGHQSLTVRSDEKIFATAGWDGRLRVYSPKSLKELAVLKWHKDGCYAAAFSEVSEPTPTRDNEVQDIQTIAKRELTVSERRTEKAKLTHWLAAGSKDGKISLWDIY